MLTLVKQRNEPVRDQAQRDETKEKNNFGTALRKLLDSKSYWPASPGGAMEAAAPDAETKIGRERCCLRCQESILQLCVSQTGPRARQLQTGPEYNKEGCRKQLAWPVCTSNGTPPRRAAAEPPQVPCITFSTVQVHTGTCWWRQSSLKQLIPPSPLLPPPLRVTSCSTGCYSTQLPPRTVIMHQLRYELLFFRMKYATTAWNRMLLCLQRVGAPRSRSRSNSECSRKGTRLKLG